MPAPSVVYQGGHPDFPKRLRGLLRVSLTNDAILAHDWRDQLVLQIPIDTLFAVKFPHVTSQQVTWDSETQRLLRGCKNPMVLGMRVNAIDHFVVFDVQSNLPYLYHVMEYAVSHSPIAEVEARDYRSRGWKWSADFGSYIGGHPRCPQPQKNIELGIASWAFTVWSANRLLFSVPFETITSVSTQFNQTSGRFFGLGAEGILEASVANFLTRRSHHGVLISAHIDQKLCGVAFNFEYPQTQLRIYDVIQTRILEHSSPNIPAEAQTSNIAEQLQAVAQLYQDGLLDETEFQHAKQQIISGS